MIAFYRSGKENVKADDKWKARAVTVAEREVRIGWKGRPRGPLVSSTDKRCIKASAQQWLLPAVDRSTTRSILSYRVLNCRVRGRKKMAGLVGKYKLASSENFGEFLKEIGVSIVTRKLAESTKPVVEITKDGDEYIIITRAFKTSEIKFKLGEEFDEKRLDGATVKTVINLEGDKLVQKQFGEKECVITREIEDGNLKVVCTSGAVISTRIYKPE